MWHGETTCGRDRPGTVIDLGEGPGPTEIWNAKGSAPWTPHNGSPNETRPRGQPQLRKSSLFNLLTGGGAKVANLPGVTVAPSAGASA